MKFSVNSLAVAIIVSLLVVADYFTAPLFFAGASFIWVAFINWNVFFKATLAERGKAIIGFIIGFGAANATVFISTHVGSITGIAIVGSIVAVFIVNWFIMYLDYAKKLLLDSIPAVFLSFALAFSGAGVSMKVSDPKLLLLIVVYGIFGLLCGLGTNFIASNINKRLKSK